MSADASLDTGKRPLVDLTDCDREPLHIPGSIQPTGVLLALSGEDWVVAQASANCAAVFGLAAEDLTGRQLRSLVPAAVLDTLWTASQRVARTGVPERCLALTLGAAGQETDALVYRSDSSTVLELETPTAAAADDVDPVQFMQSVIAELRSAPGREARFELLASRVRALTGFDRVMVYEFLHDGSGRVIAENQRAGLESYLGLHYPATDIPRQARALYVRNWLRIIADVDAAPVPILPPTDANGFALDLSRSGLRSVSPVHIQYLRNMGVSASMSLSLVCAGELWGLIACHHYAPKTIGARQRAALELLAQILSLEIETAERAEGDRHEADARRVATNIVTSLQPDRPLAEQLLRHLPSIREVIPHDGAAIWHGGRYSGEGAILPADQMPALLELLDAASPTQTYATHALPARLPAAAAGEEPICGVMAIPIAQLPADYILLFRRERVHDVDWGGDPAKAVARDGDGGALTPRSSFAAWRQTVRSRSLPWDETQRRAATVLRSALLESVLRHRDLLAREQRHESTRQELLISELNHRVKNSLALVRSLIVQGEHSAESVADYVRDVEGRIAAYAKAHDQAMRQDERSGSLRELLETELAPHRREGGPAARLDGPEIRLTPKAYTVAALVFHEMTTNAVKYGAFGEGGSAIEIAWQVIDGSELRLSWIERCAHPIQPGERRGFGSTVIEKTIPFELSGAAELAFRRNGIAARFVIPAPHFIAMDPPPSAPAADDAASDRLPAGTVVLLVEDNMLIALDGEEELKAMGAERVVLAGTMADARAALQDNPAITVALLDVHLGRDTTFDLAQELAAAAIPFIFATGHFDDRSLPENLQQAPCLSKPFEPAAMLTALLGALGRHRR